MRKSGSRRFAEKKRSSNFEVRATPSRDANLFVRWCFAAHEKGKQLEVTEIAYHALMIAILQILTFTAYN